MNEEMKSLHLNNTWTLVCRLEGSMLVYCKWSFKRKVGAPRIDQHRFKAKLVARCFTEGMN